MVTWTSSRVYGFRIWNGRPNIGRKISKNIGFSIQGQTKLIIIIDPDDKKLNQALISW